MDDKSVDELVMSYLFPPSKDVSGMVLAKRYVLEGKRFDVVQADIKDNLDLEFKRHIDEYINEQILIDVDCSPNFPDCIFDFVEKSMAELDKRQVYKTISTRVWKIANNFLALEYKLKHPEVYWKAEFSDPLMYDIYNKRRDLDKNKDVTDQQYLNRINDAISDLNKMENADFKLLDNPSNVHFLVEYFAYLFADEVIFTNVHQRQVMLDQFPVDVGDIVAKKSVIKAQPTLPEEFYHIREYDEDFDESKINVGYFGNVYSKRHFEAVFNAFEILNHKYKDKFAFYFYINDKILFKKLVENLEISDNIHIKDTIDYLDFLNLTTKFDVLLINDLITEDCFNLNPYRPSKLSDYYGSGSRIWAICEKGSILDESDVDYKSYINNTQSNVDALVEILKDFSHDDEDCFASDNDEALLKRITDLSVIVYENHKKQQSLKSKLNKLKKENEKLKKENKTIKNKNEEKASSNRGKLKNNFRKIGNRIKKQ